MEALSQVAVGTEPLVYLTGLSQESLDAIGGVEDTSGNTIDVNSLAPTDLSQ
jgi:hypothetical protein